MTMFEIYNAARLRRDPAYDGVFFIGVKSTGIYCRPICPARQPLTKNICFYPSAAAAENAGLRPCLRCRPESAPFCPAWIGTKSTVERALKLIDAGALDKGTLTDLADQLGIGVRHLNRLFQKHLEATPVQVAQTLRVQRAVRRIRETEDTMIDISLSAGFGSVRQFNNVFRTLYGFPPTRLRKPRRGHKKRDTAPI